jgi:GT2 family glycosyltransferase
MEFSIILLTYKRDDILQEQFDHLLNVVNETNNDCEVILIDNNADGKDRSSYLNNFKYSQYKQLSQNEGVAGGRNEGILSAKGDYLVFIDDDAFIYPNNCLELIKNNFLNDPKVKIQAFKSINFNTKKMDRVEFPHPDKNKDADIPFKTFRFIGVAHAIRADLFNYINLYQADFFYMAEEWDLSYACINAGFEILYFPKVWVYHKKHIAGRLINLTVLENSLLNKMKIGYRFLKWPYFILNIIIWTVFVIIKSKFRVNILLLYFRYFKWLKITKVTRTILNKEAITYIHNCGGSVWRR